MLSLSHKSITKSFRVYSQRQTYDVVADVASYSGFVPFCIGSRILSSLTPEPDSSRKLTMNAELIIEFLSYKKGYISKVTCVPGESVEATTSSSLFQTLSAIWRFQPASPQSSHSPDTSLRPHTESTLVTLDLVYAFTNPIHAGICAAFSNQWSPFILKAFEERCQFLYGSHIQ